MVKKSEILKRTCVICEKYFETPDTKRGAKKKTCGDRKCSTKLGALNMERIKTKCTLCGKDALVTKSHINDKKVYCSICKDNPKRILKSCSECGKEFYTQHRSAKTCSKSCASKLGSKNIIEVNCTECSNSISRPTRDVYSGKNIFCDKTCGNRFHSRIRPKKYGNNWSKWLLYIKDRDSYTCQKCNKSNKDFPQLKLEVHHKKPLISFDVPEDAHFDENLITYCHDCHMEVEREIKNKAKLSMDVR